MSAKEDLSRNIRTASDRFEQHFKGGDAEALVNDYYVSDELGPMMSAPDTPLLTGRSAISGLFSELVKLFSECRLEAVEITASGDLAQELGRASILDRAGDSHSARYAILWRHTPAGWRVQSDFFAWGDLT